MLTPREVAGQIIDQITKAPHLSDFIRYDLAAHDFHACQTDDDYGRFNRKYGSIITMRGVFSSYCQHFRPNWCGKDSAGNWFVPDAKLAQIGQGSVGEGLHWLAIELAVLDDEDRRALVYHFEKYGRAVPDHEAKVVLEADYCRAFPRDCSGLLTVNSYRREEIGGILGMADLLAAHEKSLKPKYDLNVPGLMQRDYGLPAVGDTIAVRSVEDDGAAAGAAGAGAAAKPKKVPVALLAGGAAVLGILAILAVRK